MVYNADPTVVNKGRILSIHYSPSHWEALRNYLYVASYLDLSREASALLLVPGRVCITKSALMAFLIASSMQGSSTVSIDISHEGEKERLARVPATIVPFSSSPEEYEG
jgi:hypothetical protein